MFGRWKKEFSLFAIVGALAVSLAGCGLSNGYGESRSNSKSDSRVQSLSSPSSEMPNMEMPSKPSTKAAASPAMNQVVIENFSFVPATMTVKAGTKVTWVNRDDVPHTATDTDKRFNSKTLDTDDQFAFTFQQPGTYSYFCALHPKMTGQIIVK
jgi:plastocyanin